MPRATQQPTELELKILHVLWNESPLPVREVRQRLAVAGRELAHTSVITMLNIMVRKGFLKRSRQGNALLFAPRLRGKACRGGSCAVWSTAPSVARPRP